ncbi:hypothetical protein J3E64_000640 [Sphingobium sp. OAS761]|uniref:hypothetical protein n=1 Tax=Sphingobium sp. OAS761 TaxID=2817901 RepID=UPI0020A017DD|nr:hypothetical protein [Sphingobium sp. OAS761]MCP1468969.1 hypothetical protein [Sphingobium sp. OAS761]
MPEPFSPTHAYICHVCGSDHVVRDAWATWDVQAQLWVLDTLFDHAHCHQCLGATRMERVLLTSPVTFAAPDRHPSDERPQ